jgi:hypothetical protein
MKKYKVIPALVLAICTQHAYADNGTGVTITGFGSAAVTTTNTDKAEFSRPNQARGVRENLATGVDSNVGLQASMPINDWLSVTAQGLVRKDAEDDFGGELAWAFAKAIEGYQCSSWSRGLACLHDLRLSQRRLRQYHVAPSC